MSQVILSYKFPPKHFNSQKAYFNNLNKNTVIAYTNDKCNSSNYQQCGQTPALLVMECFRDSFLKPYVASSAKQPEPCFHCAWKQFIKKYYDVLSPSFQLHHTVNKILILLLKPGQVLNYQCFHKELSSITISLIRVWKYLKSHQISTIYTEAWFLAIENI